MCQKLNKLSSDVCSVVNGGTSLQLMTWLSSVCVYNSANWVDVGVGGYWMRKLFSRKPQKSLSRCHNAHKSISSLLLFNTAIKFNWISISYIL